MPGRHTSKCDTSIQWASLARWGQQYTLYIMVYSGWKAGGKEIPGRAVLSWIIPISYVGCVAWFRRTAMSST